MKEWLRMDIVEISYIDTAELDSYIREAIKCWNKSDVIKWCNFTIRTRRVWRDESSTKAVYYCLLEYPFTNIVQSLMIYVDYDEVEMMGKIEIEYLASFSRVVKEGLVDIFNEVVGSFDPSTAPLPFGVKCPHCQARYVYSKRTGVVKCQNCAKSFALELQENGSISPSESVNQRVSKSKTYSVTVDKNKVTHCAWCGRIESYNWVYSRGNTAFCSRDCFHASNLEMNGIASISCLCAFPLFLIAIIAARGLAFEGVILIFVSLLLAAISVYGYATGRRVRKDVPKMSRRP